MRNKIIPRWSDTAGKVPQASDLETHEIAINTADKKIYTKDANGDIIELSNLLGDDTQRFKVAPAQNNNEAVSLGQFEFSNSSYSGYEILPNGLIIQWLGTADNGDNCTRDFYYPIAFPNKCLSVVATGTGTGGSENCSVPSFYDNKCTINHEQKNRRARIIAIGY